MPLLKAVRASSSNHVFAQLALKKKNIDENKYVPSDIVDSDDSCKPNSFEAGSW